MSTSIVSRCLSCRAIINLTWKACPTCSTPVDASPRSTPTTAPVQYETALPDRPPTPPLQPGWVVTYTDQRGRLCGGWDERAHSTVKQCHGTGQGCQVELSDGRRISLRAVCAVGQTNADGRLIAAWTVRE